MSSIPDHYPFEYETRIRSELQQLTSRVKGWLGQSHAVPEEGKRFQIGGASASENRTRGWTNTDPNQPARRERWLKMIAGGARDFNKNDEWIDELDAKRLGKIGDPTPERIAMQMAAAGRDCDEAILDGLSGVAYQGKDGTTSIAYNSTYSIPVATGGADTAMNYAKFNRLRALLGAANVTGQRVEHQSAYCIILTHFDLEELLLDDKFINGDYATRARAESGQIFDYGNCTFIPVSPYLLPISGSSGSYLRTCYGFAKEAVAFGTGCDISTRVTQEGTKNSAILLHAVYGYTMTRLHDKGVYKILCHRTDAEQAVEAEFENVV